MTSHEPDVVAAASASAVTSWLSLISDDAINPGLGLGLEEVNVLLYIHERSKKLSATSSKLR